MSINLLRKDYSIDTCDYEIVCDECGESEEFEESSFDECRFWMKENNWKTIKDKTDGWVNYCPECFKARWSIDNRFGIKKIGGSKNV